MNNGKYHTEQYQQLQSSKNDRLFGPIEEHSKTCEVCKNEFKWLGRKNTKAFEKIRFCSRKCANSVGGKILADKRESDGISHYRTICKKYHKWKCVVCDEHLILEVHHLNEDHEDNSPNNLVPLCPTHHQYIHSPYRGLIEPIIEKYIGGLG